MTRALAYVIIIALSLALVPIFDGDGPQGLLIGIAGGFLVPLTDQALRNINFIRIAWYSIRYRNHDIRVSASYLYRIEDRGQYLLVKGNRYADQYQPVGGVYKLANSARERMLKWRVRDDDLIPLDEVSENDIRIRIPGKHLLAFVRWYEAEQERETDPWREFYEELVAPGTLPLEVFPWVFSTKVRRQYLPLRYSAPAGAHELLVADIFSLTPNSAQLKLLRALKLQTAADTYWATSEEIKRRGAAPGRPASIKIALTAEWLL